VISTKLSAWYVFIVVVVTASCARLNSSVSAEIPEPQSPNRSVEFAVNEIALNLPLTQPKIVIDKSNRRLKLYSSDKLVRTFRIGLGASPVEDKVKEGDRKTPEGTFYVFTKNDKSAYYLSLGLSYPNAEDAERGLRDGLINRAEYEAIVDAVSKKVAPPQKTALGGEIYIHGNGSQSDWTWGCVALDNENMRELFDAVPVGTEVMIEP
jgi:murein L,D-transpeptidase YafK